MFNNLKLSHLSEPRTFGHHFLKRVSFALIPASFVVGVITTLLAALTVVSIKGLGVGVRTLLPKTLRRQLLTPKSFTDDSAYLDCWSTHGPESPWNLTVCSSTSTSSFSVQSMVRDPKSDTGTDKYRIRNVI